MREFYSVAFIEIPTFSLDKQAKCYFTDQNFSQNRHFLSSKEVTEFGVQNLDSPYSKKTLVV